MPPNDYRSTSTTTPVPKGHLQFSGNSAVALPTARCYTSEFNSLGKVVLLPFKYKFLKKEVVVWAFDKLDADERFEEFASEQASS